MPVSTTKSRFQWGRSTSRATGMTHPFPRAGDEVVRIVRETGGRGWAVADEDSFAAARWLARHEGLFLQPAAAASASCLMTGQLADVGQKQVVVGIGTGSGKNQVAARAGRASRRTPESLPTSRHSKPRSRASNLTTCHLRHTDLSYVCARQICSYV